MSFQRALFLLDFYSLLNVELFSCKLLPIINWKLCSFFSILYIMPGFFTEEYLYMCINIKIIIIDLNEIMACLHLIYVNF